MGPLFKQRAFLFVFYLFSALYISVAVLFLRLTITSIHICNFSYYKPM